MAPPMALQPATLAIADRPLTTPLTVLPPPIIRPLSLPVQMEQVIPCSGPENQLPSARRSIKVEIQISEGPVAPPTKTSSLEELLTALQGMAFNTKSATGAS